MIKRINTLNRTGRFIQLANDRGEEGDFSQFNVVYAGNASGKSTLCDVLRSMTTGEPSYVMGRKRLDADAAPEIVIAMAGEPQTQIIRFDGAVWHNGAASPCIHIYDDRFVAENVLVGHHINVDQRRNLYGLVIGAQAIALKQAVDDAEQILSAASEAAKQAEGELQRLIPIMDSIEDFRDVPQEADVERRIAAAEEALAAATQTKSKADAIRQRGLLSPLTVADIPVNLTRVLSTTLDDAALAAEQTIRDHMVETSDGLTIGKLGEFHRAQTGTGCPHCGQDMEGLGILRAYQAFFSGELQAQEDLRNVTKTEVDRAFSEMARSQLLETLTAHETERTWWRDAAGYQFELPEIRDRDRLLQAHGTVLTAITDALARKQANPGSPITLTDDENDALTEWGVISAELTTYNSQLTALNQTLTERKAQAATIDLTPLQSQLSTLQQSQRRHQQNVIDAYATYDAAILAKTNAQQAKEAANEALRQHSNQLLEEYGVKINDLLRLFSANFRIVSEGVTFRGQQPSGNLAIKLLDTTVSCTPADAANPATPSLANTLSGGDRSALALAFFLAKVENDPNLADCVVVFDDPYHNQDRSRQQRTIERIHRIARNSKQSIVFSHDLDFARAVEPVTDINVRTFELCPLTDRTVLEPKELPMLPSRAYEVKYKMLNDFIASPADFTNQLNQVAGALRTILEEYLKLKFPLRWEEGRDWLGTMIGKIRDAVDDDPLCLCQGLVGDLTDVNEYSQRFHHRTTGATADVPDARELGSYAEQTLSIIHQ